MALKEPSRLDVANKIKEIRTRKHLTQLQLARLLGMKQSAVKNYEGGRIPGGVILAKLAQIGDVNVDWILGLNVGPENKILIPDIEIARLVRKFETMLNDVRSSHRPTSGSKKFISIVSNHLTMLEENFDVLLEARKLRRNREQIKVVKGKTTKDV